MAAKCFYLSRNLFPSFGYGKLKCVFAVIWLYTWYMKVKIWGSFKGYYLDLLISNLKVLQRSFKDVIWKWFLPHEMN